MMSTMIEIALAWIAGASMIAGQLPSPPPVADGDAPQAEAMFAGAERLYVDGRLSEAIAAYQSLFVQTGEPVCLANLGRLYLERGDAELAVEYYRQFLLHPRAAEWWA